MKENSDELGLAPMTLLQIRDLTKSFESETIAAVAGASFAVAKGEIICLLGPSGCGKTTLLRMIAGLEKPDRGDVLLRGQSITSVTPHQRDFGMMFQDFALFPHKNVFDNVAFGLRMQKWSKEKVVHRVEQVLQPGAQQQRLDVLFRGHQGRQGRRQRIHVRRSRLEDALSGNSGAPLLPDHLRQTSEDVPVGCVLVRKCVVHLLDGRSLFRQPSPEMAF